MPGYGSTPFPLPQGAVLALLRAVGDSVSLRLMLWSVSNFTNGATVFADTQGVALFQVAADGDVVPRNSNGRALMPAVPLEPAFATPLVVEPEPVPETEDDEEKVEGEASKSPGRIARGAVPPTTPERISVLRAARTSMGGSRLSPRRAAPTSPARPNSRTGLWRPEEGSRLASRCRGRAQTHRRCAVEHAAPMTSS